MLIITQDADASFSRELDFCLKKNESWRCIVLKFSQTIRKPENWFSRLIEKVGYCLGTGTGWVFLHDNGDVSILNPHATQKSFHHLMRQLEPMIPEDLSALYELPIDYETVRALRAEKNQPMERVRDMPKPALYVDPFHQQMVESLSERRAKRDKPVILIVEDDPFSQRLVAKSLEETFGTFTASSGQEALFSYIRNAPDIVFLDIGLPDVNGLELLLKISEIDTASHIVMLSGNGSQGNIIKALENGAKGFVAKPFSREKLHQHIHKCASVQSKMKKKMA